MTASVGGFASSLLRSPLSRDIVERTKVAPVVTLCIIGFPFVGKEALARAVAAEGVATLVLPGDITRHVKRRQTPAAIAAHDLMCAGGIPSDEALAILWTELTPPKHDAVTPGLPKCASQYENYADRSGRDLWLVHLRTNWRSLVDRMEALGAGNIERGHPGAEHRITAAISELAELGRRTDRYLELEPFRPLPETVSAVLEAVWARRSCGA